MEQSIIGSMMKTTYRVLQYDVEIKPGQKNPPLDNLLAQHDQTDWAYLTPWNPYCETLSEKENMERLGKLKKKLEAYTVLEGEAMSEDVTFKPERCFLILGI